MPCFRIFNFGQYLDPLAPKSGSKLKIRKHGMWGVYLLRNSARNSMKMSKKILVCPYPQYLLCIVCYKCLKMNYVFSGLRVAETTWAFNRAENG